MRKRKVTRPEAHPSLTPVTVERRDIDRVETLANAEQENADDDEGDQDGEGDADLDHERHALGAGGGKHEPILQRHEADHLTYGVPARHHHQQAEQHHRERKGEVLARERPAPSVARSVTTMASATRPMPSSMVRPMPPTVSISRWMPSFTIMR